MAFRIVEPDAVLIWTDPLDGEVRIHHRPYDGRRVSEVFAQQKEAKTAAEVRAALYAAWTAFLVRWDGILLPDGRPAEVAEARYPQLEPILVRWWQDLTSGAAQRTRFEAERKN